MKQNISKELIVQSPDISFYLFLLPTTPLWPYFLQMPVLPHWVFYGNTLLKATRYIREVSTTVDKETLFCLKICSVSCGGEKKKKKKKKG